MASLYDLTCYLALPRNKCKFVFRFRETLEIFVFQIVSFQSHEELVLVFRFIIKGRLAVLIMIFSMISERNTRKLGFGAKQAAGKVSENIDFPARFSKPNPDMESLRLFTGCNQGWQSFAN